MITVKIIGGFKNRIFHYVLEKYTLFKNLKGFMPEGWIKL